MLSVCTEIPTADHSAMVSTHTSLEILWAFGGPREVWEDTFISRAATLTTLASCSPFYPISLPTLLLCTSAVLSLSLGKEMRAEAGPSSQSAQRVVVHMEEQHFCRNVLPSLSLLIKHCACDTRSTGRALLMMEMPRAITTWVGRSYSCP